MNKRDPKPRPFIATDVYDYDHNTVIVRARALDVTAYGEYITLAVAPRPSIAFGSKLEYTEYPSHVRLAVVYSPLLKYALFTKPIPREVQERFFEEDI